MKKIKYLFCIISSLLIFVISGCEKNDQGEQGDDSGISPRIFNEQTRFVNNVPVLTIGQTYEFSNLVFSPGSKVAISWLVNDTEVSKAESYTFTATEPGDYRVRLSVSYGGVTTNRYVDLYVLPATIPGAFTPKSYTNVVNAYLSNTATNLDVWKLDYSKITHVTYKVATVTSTAGALDVSKGDGGSLANHLVTRAHNKGVPVLMGISGTLSGNASVTPPILGDGWSTATDLFGATLRNNTARAALVQVIKTYLTNKKMDGVDIMMTDLGNAANGTATATFLNELRAALSPNAIITVTVAVNAYHTNYPNLSAANWLNVRAFQDASLMAIGQPRVQASNYNYFVTSAELWKAKFPGSKLVLGIPAFGVRHNQVNSSGNISTATSYDFIAYKDILGAVPSAFDQEYAAIAQGVYFNGTPLVNQKAKYAKDNGYLGVYLWGADFDVPAGEKSLINAAAAGLN